MANPVAIYILQQQKVDSIALHNYCNQTRQHLLLFAHTDTIQPQTIYEYLKVYKKFRHYTFAELLSYNIVNMNECDSYGMSLIENIIADDNLQFFILLLQHNVELDARLCKAATRRIGRFLAYSPGRNTQSIAEYCMENLIRNQQKLADLVYDETHTTSGESSEEDIPLVADPWQPAAYEANEARIKQFIKTHGADLADYLKENPEDLAPVVVTYRGVHFVPKHYNNERRQRLRQARTTTGRPTVSYATLTDMGYEADDESLNPDEVAAGRRKTKSFFDSLRSAQDKREPNKASRNKFNFPNLFYRFIQAYVMNYDYLFSGENPAITTFFDASTKANPAISTSYLAQKAMQYMAGVRFPNKRDLRLDPHYRRSTKKPKHPYLGYTDVYVFDPSFLWQNGHYILDLMRRSLINISHIFQFEAEILFESDIPGQYHYYRDIYHVPDFSQTWTSRMETDFGYSKALWSRHRNALAKILTKDNYNKWLENVMEHVIAHRAVMLEKLLKYLLATEVDKRFPIIPYMEGSVVDNPSNISPQNKGKWKKITPGTPDEPFYQQMKALTLQSQAPSSPTKNVYMPGIPQYPTFNLSPDQWTDHQPNQVPDHIVATGIQAGSIIVVNDIQYTIRGTAGMQEPNTENPHGKIFIAVPRLRGG
jgi:hypothetical protein